MTSKTILPILDYGLWNEAFNAASQYGTSKYGKRKTKALAEAQAAILKDLLEMLEDEDYRYESEGHSSLGMIRNELRAELRKRIREYCGGRE